MQQYTVPQFIDVEDKIFGPITTRQFVILLGSFLIIGIAYKLFDFSLFITFGVIVLIISGAFAFVRINGRPFHFFVLNIIQTFRRANLRVWRKNIIWSEESSKEEASSKIIEKNIPIQPKPQPSISRLAELSLIVDTKGVYQGEVKDEKVDIKLINNNNLSNKV
ncbi:MAG: PrgI family protein [Patescibacteria group bacterium]